MLKRTLACALFAITGHAYSADIQVTTLVDEDKDDSVCSLREAVFFLNNRSNEEFENGYKGCGNKDSSSTIILKRDQEYKLNSPIAIKAAMTISTQASTDFNDRKRGLNNATISANGQHRLFDIDDGSVEDALIIVNLKDLNLQGTSTQINNNGGLILNREDLRIEYSRLINGHANKGGAIYNVGILSDTQKTAGKLLILNSIFQNNKAEQGAVIYSEMPRYLISHSIIRDNEGVSGETGALIYIQTGLSDQTIGNFPATGESGIRNSTIFHNKGGYVANIREGMVLNNLTIIKNAAGLYLQALKEKVTTVVKDDGEPEEKVTPYPKSYVSNSIIVENGNKNCMATTNDTTVVQSNLTTVECDQNPAERLPNFMIGNNKLIAGENDEGICDSPPADGLLCPYKIPKDQMLGFFKPRLLASYSKLSDSLIVNKGRIYSDGTSFSLAGCERSDQRGINRSGYNELCDLGAIELVVDRSNIPIAGQDILFKEIAKFNISESLADGELLDPATCEKILGKRSDEQEWRYGCLEIVQNQTPSKGTLTLDQDGNVTYVPDSNWHGADMFKMRIITTTTRFNDASSRYIEIPTNIVQEPKNNFQSKKVNVGGGSIGFGAILMLFGLMGLRRFKS
ncbi:rhombotarget A [Acinetobacter sp. NIPH 2699]|uniref:rhombotarget A n=1 Tax=Acinetobacter sp. NIPH 2699 TaxID=2923433 RepID=UPI001F4AA7FB|nr:rhombotarget A [Acinetobacter sp. NIPH 2699]MCH7336042.1 rhombotarget A [Acinetobacter sp. NIPH 2699]